MLCCNALKLIRHQTVPLLQMFQEGIAAEKRTLRYLPMIRDIELPRRLAKVLMVHYFKSGLQG
jgi:hypothetical protein